MPQFPQHCKVKITKNYINGGYIFKINSSIGFTPKEMKKKYSQEMASMVSLFRKYVDGAIRDNEGFGNNFIIDIKAPVENVFYKRNSLFKGTYFVSVERNTSSEVVDEFVNTINKKLTELLLENGMTVIGYDTDGTHKEINKNNLNAQGIIGIEAEWHIPSLPLFYCCEVQK